MKAQQIRFWFARMQDDIDHMDKLASRPALLHKHLVANGFPDTEMDALRAAIAAAEDALTSLQQAVYTGLDIPQIQV